jgi:uncharacterized membrane protein
MNGRFMSGRLGGMGLVVIAAAMSVEPESARAEDGFELCNRTRLNVVYAKALNTKDEKTSKTDIITSEGWFNLAPSQCEILYSGSLKYRYYLVYAEAKNSNRKWTGDKRICVDVANFKLTGELCRPNRRNRMFIEVDTGDADTFTYDLK